MWPSHCTTSTELLMNNSTSTRDLSWTVSQTLFTTATTACAVMTVLGNLLVILAVVREVALRSVTNYFIVSLACADTLMGVVVMPFAIYAEVQTGGWIFGPLGCDLWHAVDVLSSTASILNLCAISLERYWAISRPLTYTRKVNKKRCFAMLLCVWLSASLISFPAIFWWQATDGRQQQTRNTTEVFQCVFTADPVYLITSSIVSFYAPLTVMLLVYFRIYRTAMVLLRSVNSGSKVIYQQGAGESIVMRIHRGGTRPGGLNQSLEMCDCSLEGFQDRPEDEAEEEEDEENIQVTTPLQSAPVDRRHLTMLANGDEPGSSQDSGNGIHRRSSTFSHFSVDRRPSIFRSKWPRMSMEFNSSSLAQRITNRLRATALHKRFTAKFGREQKAAKTLGVVMGVFVGCWTPFFLCSLIQAIAPQVMASPTARYLYTAATWLGYLNSSMNPFIYAHSMRDFRKAFLKILCGWYQRRKYNEVGVNFFFPEASVHTFSHNQHSRMMPTPQRLQRLQSVGNVMSPVPVLNSSRMYARHSSGAISTLLATHGPHCQRWSSIQDGGLFPRHYIPSTGRRISVGRNRDI